MKITCPQALRRRTLGASLAILSMLGLAAPNGAQAQNWPERPVKLLVPFAAGGNIDVTGRIVAARLSEKLGQQFIVENRVGGGGAIAAEAVARAPADGYTLLWGATNVIAILPHISKVQYDSQKDLAPVFALGSSPQILLVNSKIPANSVPEFVAWVKSQPDRVAYGGGGGAGSASNLIMAQLLKRAGLKMTFVGYRGTAPALTDVIAGHIPVTFIPILEAYAQRTNPNIRMLAISSGKRSPRLPDVPSLAEFFPGYDAVSWTGMFAPAGTPKAIVDKVAGEMDRALKDPKFLGLITDNGIDPLGYGPGRFAEFIKSEYVNWGEAVDIAGVKR